MIKNYNKYIKESSVELSQDEYLKMVNIISKMVKDGDITLNKSIDYVVSKIVGKDKKYPRFEFESLMMNLSDDKQTDFISAGDQKRMDEYIDKIKKLGIDTTKLEKLYPSYKRYWYIIYTEEEKIMYNDDLDDVKIKKELDKLRIEQDKLKEDVDKFEEELKRLSKEVVKKL